MLEEVIDRWAKKISCGVVDDDYVLGIDKLN